MSIEKLSKRIKYSLIALLIIVILGGSFFLLVGCAWGGCPDWLTFLTSVLGWIAFWPGILVGRLLLIFGIHVSDWSGMLVISSVIIWPLVIYSIGHFLKKVKQIRKD
ncbi:MAG: hypothetical protein ACPGO5_02935 [Patescibacteria group bacterium]